MNFPDNLSQLAQAPIWSQITCSGTDCNSCHFTQGVNILLEFLIYFAGVVAVLMFVYAGFLLLKSAGNPSELQRAKGIFMGVVVGFVVTISAFLIVDLVIKTFVSGEAGQRLGPWNEIVCDGGDFGTPSGGEGTNDSGTDDGKVSGDAELEQCTRDYLKDKIEINKEACSFHGQRNCTDVRGIPKSNLDKLIELEKICGCEVVITGGTEGGAHREHGVGKNRVDIRRNQKILNYLIGNGKAGTETHKKKNAQGVEYNVEYNVYTIGPFQYVDEEDHFHIRYYGLDPTPYQCPTN